MALDERLYLAASVVAVVLILTGFLASYNNLEYALYNNLEYFTVDQLTATPADGPADGFQKRAEVQAGPSLPALSVAYHLDSDEFNASLFIHQNRSTDYAYTVKATLQSGKTMGVLGEELFEALNVALAVAGESTLQEHYGCLQDCPEGTAIETVVFFLDGVEHKVTVSERFSAPEELQNALAALDEAFSVAKRV